MSRLALVLALLVSFARAARADDDLPLYKCRPVAATTKVSVQFQPEVSLKDLTTWVLGFTCKNVVFGADVAKHATKITVVAPNTMTPKQALQLYVDAVESTGLVVTVKTDTIVIKLGPGMPKGCPDSAPSGDPLASSGPTSSRVPPSSPEPELTAADLDTGIKVVDATHREISRALVDKVLANPMAVAKGARVVPAVKNGKPIGFKLFAIRTGSFYARLGFENGDTLMTINGFELTSADKALEVYTKLREATVLQLELERRGKPVTLNITLK